MQLRFQPVSAPAGIEPASRSTGVATGADQLFGPWFERRLSQSAPAAQPESAAPQAANQSPAPAADAPQSSAPAAQQPQPSANSAPPTRPADSDPSASDELQDPPSEEGDERGEELSNEDGAEVQAAVAVIAAEAEPAVDVVKPADAATPVEAIDKPVVETPKTATPPAKPNERRGAQPAAAAPAADSTPDQLPKVETDATQSAAAEARQPEAAVATTVEVETIAQQPIVADAPKDKSKQPAEKGQRASAARSPAPAASPQTATHEVVSPPQDAIGPAAEKLAADSQPGNEASGRDDRRPRVESRRASADESQTAEPAPAAAEEPATFAAAPSGNEIVDAAPSVDPQPTVEAVDPAAPPPAQASSDATAAPANDRARHLERVETASRAATGAEHRTNAAEVSRARFVQRVAGAFQAAVDRGAPVRLRLSPAELGNLKIEISIRQGVMTARVEAESAAARTALLEGLPQLRERLAEQNVKIERFDVELSNQSAADPRQPHDGPAERGRPRSGNATRGAANVQAGAADPAASADRGRTLDASLNIVV